MFLFNEKEELLLQQRAASKITFPSVWTNTCCSHPLYGYEPSEVEELANTARGATPGTVDAAVRKLEHELGIAPEHLPRDGFKFLTRLHYCASMAPGDNATGEVRATSQSITNERRFALDEPARKKSPRLAPASACPLGAK